MAKVGAEVSDADFGRLEKIARIYATKTRGRMSPTDLLNEAVLRTLDGRRKWKRTVALLKHLEGAMKSIASHAKSPPEWEPPGPDPDGAESRDAVGELVQAIVRRGRPLRGTPSPSAIATPRRPSDPDSFRGRRYPAQL